MKNNQGSVLTVTLIFILAFTLFGFSSIYLSTVQNEAAEKRTSSTKAFWLAEAGLQTAILKLKNSQPSGFLKKGKQDACANLQTCGAKTLDEKICSDASNVSSGSDCPVNTISLGQYFIDIDNVNNVITSTGTSGSAQRSVRTVIKRNSKNKI